MEYFRFLNRTNDKDLFIFLFSSEPVVKEWERPRKKHMWTPSSTSISSVRVSLMILKRPSAATLNSRSQWPWNWRQQILVKVFSSSTSCAGPTFIPSWSLNTLTYASSSAASVGIKLNQHNVHFFTQFWAELSKRRGKFNEIANSLFCLQSGWPTSSHSGPVSFNFL